MDRSFLQMNSVPRLDSPRNVPIRPLDFGHPMSNRMITNSAHNTLQTAGPDSRGYA